MTFIADNPRSWRPDRRPKAIFFEIQPEQLLYQHNCWVVYLDATPDIRDGDTLTIVWSDAAIEKMREGP